MIPEKPLISVILPVLREEAIINDALDRLDSAAGEYPRETIVVDGDPGGTTTRAITRRGVITLVSPRGRARQMNYGATNARGTILLFLHADTSLPDGAFDRIRTAMALPGIAGGAFRLAFDSGHFWLRATAVMAHLRTRLTRVPFGDQGIFLRADLFRDLGGYRELPLMEDVDLMKRLRKRRGEIIILPEKIITSSRKWFRDGLYYTTLRNWTLQALFAMGVPPEKLVRYYYGDE